jgi:hypothetical protein
LGDPNEVMPRGKTFSQLFAGKARRAKGSFQCEVMPVRSEARQGRLRAVAIAETKRTMLAFMRWLMTHRVSAKCLDMGAEVGGVVSVSVIPGRTSGRLRRNLAIRDQFHFRVALYP